MSSENQPRNPGGSLALAEAKEQARQEAMFQQLERRRADRWPLACPLCGAAVGQRCLTRNGKRAREHVVRRS